MRRSTLNHSLDVISLKESLSNLGLYEIPRGGANAIDDAGLYNGILRVQSANNLAVVSPGGPTERTLNRALAANDNRPTIAGPTPPVVPKPDDPTPPDDPKYPQVKPPEPPDPPWSKGKKEVEPGIFIYEDHDGPKLHNRKPVPRLRTQLEYERIKPGAPYYDRNSGGFEVKPKR